MNKVKTEKVLFIDFETRSFADITTVGAYNYAFDKTTEIILCAFRFSNQAQQKITLWQPGKALPKSLIDFEGSIVAHNYKFEYYIINACLVKRGLLPESYSDLSRYRCTSATARRCGLPASLAEISKQLNLTHRKLSEEGSQLIKKYSIPKINKQTKEKYFEEITKEDKKLWIAYVSFDVLATEEIYNMLPKLHLDPFESSIFDLDKKMSFAGVNIDRRLVERLSETYNGYQELAEIEAEKIAGRVGEKKTDTLTIKSPQGFVKWINENGPGAYQVENSQAFTLSTYLKNLDENKEADKKVIKAIKLRRALAAAAPKKLDAMLNFSDLDGKSRDSILYYGAHTGRFAGRGWQPHNLPRMSSKNFEVDVQNLLEKKVAVENAPDKINEILRQCIIPTTGKVFLIGDYKAIEAKITFWLAGCEKGLQIYRDGGDIYKETAATIFKKDVTLITDKERALGKKAILGLGYGMGIDRFIESCLQDDIKLDHSLASSIVNTYRITYKEITAMWYLLERCFKQALYEGKSVYTFPYGSILFSISKLSLKVTLPSGRILYYFKPQLQDSKFCYQNPRDKFVTMWGGMMAENLIQAIARDVLLSAILKCTEYKLNPVLTIHDEIICEVDADKEKESLEIFEKIMTLVLPWTKGLPTGAECVASKRYRKI